MTESSAIPNLTQAVQRYLDLMYDGDLSHFDEVFVPTAQLHGLRGDKLVMLTAAAFKDLIASRPSPKSQGAPREEQILMTDLAAPSQAVVKLRVRIAQNVYVDNLVYHLVDGAWRVTAKGFHIEKVLSSPTAAS